MDFDLFNKGYWGRKNTVSNYIQQNTLQKPEAKIFKKYREYILGKHILDIGCGAGRTTAFLKDLSPHYTGIDYSFEMIEYCQKIFQGIRFINCDVRDMSTFENSTFDFILFSYNGLDYIGHKDRLTGLKEIQRVLRDNGMFVFSSHNRNYIHASSPPRMAFTSNPCVLIVRFIRFMICSYNHLKNKRYECCTKEYSIINDNGENYGLLTYYIDQKSQVSQLNQVGFEIIEMYDVDGNVLDLNVDVSHSPWIYYVTRKIYRETLVHI